MRFSLKIYVLAATDIKTLLCKWFSLNKRNFFCSFREAMIINEDSRFNLFIKMCFYSSFCYLSWYFFDKTKGRFVTFSIVFLSKRRKKLHCELFYWKFSFVIFSIASSGWKSYRNYEVDLESSGKNNKLWLFLSTW